MGGPDFQLFSSLRFDPLLRQSDANSALHGGESPFYMLSYHRDRILQAATHFGFSEVVALLTGPAGLEHLQQELEKSIDIGRVTPLRVKVIVDYAGNFTIETNETPSVPLSNLFPTGIPSPRTPGLTVSPLTGGALTLGREDTLKGSGNGEAQQQEPWTVVIDSKGTQSSPFTTYKTTSRNMYSEARDRVGIKTMTEPKEVLIINLDNNEIMEGSLTTVYFWRRGRWVTPPVTSGGQMGTTRRWLLEKGLCEEEPVISDTIYDGEECWISNGVRGLSWGKIKRT